MENEGKSVPFVTLDGILKIFYYHNIQSSGQRSLYKRGFIFRCICWCSLPLFAHVSITKCVCMVKIFLWSYCFVSLYSRYLHAFVSFGFCCLPSFNWFVVGSVIKCNLFLPYVMYVLPFTVVCNSKSNGTAI